MQQSVVLEHQFPEIADDFESVRTRQLRRRDDQMADHAAWMLEIRRHLVLDLDIVVFADMRMTGYQVRQPEQPLVHIERMRALIGQNAAAFAGPSSAPAPAVVIRLGTEPFGMNPRRPRQPAKRAACQQFLQLGVAGQRPFLEHDGELQLRILLLGGLVGVDHLPRGVDMDRDRLLAHDVDASLKRFHRDARMIVMRHRDDHQLQPRLLQQLDGIVIRGRSVRLCRGIRLLPVDIANADQLRVVHFAQILDMMPTDAADSDEPDPDLAFAHWPVPPHSIEVLPLILYHCNYDFLDEIDLKVDNLAQNNGEAAGC